MTMDENLPAIVWLPVLIGTLAALARIRGHAWMVWLGLKEEQ